MKLKKLLATISLLFVFTFSSFADLTVAEYKQLLQASSIALTQTNELIKDRLEKIISKSWLLDGYPRNLQQAEFLDEITKVDLFLLLDISRDIITKRILGRYSCKSCGEIHNKYTLPPKKEGICNNCGEEIKFEQRSDDNEETLKNRLDAYEKNAKPIIKYYKKKKLLKKVNAENTLELTGEQIKVILEI